MYLPTTRWTLQTTLVRQTAGALGVALECQVILKDIQMCNKEYIDKLASTEEEMKKIKVRLKSRGPNKLKR